MQELEQIVQEMMNAGYSKEKIEEVILFYNEKYASTDVEETKPNEAYYPLSGDPIEFKEDEDGRRMYFSKPDVGGESRYLREVGYEYDRSKGIRLEVDSYGKYLDNLAYKIIAPFVKSTVSAVETAQEGEYTDEMLDIIERGSTSDMTIEEATKTIEIMQRQSEKAPSEEILKWSKTMEEESNPIYGFFKATVENPVAAYEAIVSSVAGQVKALKSGELTTAALAAGGVSSKFGGPVPQLRVAAFIRGFMSTMGGGVEAASKFGELLKQEFADEENPNGRIPTEQELIDFVKNEEKFNKFRNKALLKGATITAVDNFGGGIVASSVAKTAKTGKKVIATFKGLAGETIVGGGGEALSSVVIGEEINATDVGLEILGQGGQATVDIGGALITPGSFKVNGEKANLKQVNKILETATTEELAKINIEVKNNKALENEVRKKQNDAFLETQVDAKIDDEGDRKKMVELEKQRVKAENDVKKKGIQTVPGAKEALENIEMQMNDIVGKYTAIDGRTADVKARKKTAEQVRFSRKQILMDKITQGVKESRTYKKMDIETKEVDTELEARELFEENINKEILTLQEELKNTDLSQEERAEIENELQMAQQAISDIDSKKSEAGLSHGFLLEDAQTGKMTIVINKEKALADGGGNINVAAHEFLHAVLKRTFGDKSALAPASDLMEFLNKNKQLDGTDFIARLQSYQPGETQNQEVFTLLSDSIITGDITYNEGFAEKLSNLVSDFLTAYIPGRKIKFKDGRDAFRFIKNYNKSVQGSRIASKLVEKAQKEGIKIEGEQAQPTPTPLSKEASDNVQRIYDEQGEAGAMDIINAFKPITNKIVERRSQAPNFDRQLLTDEIETGKRGIFDLIRSYDPNKGVPLAAYINQNLPSRAIEASRRVLGEEFTEDITERVDVAAEEVTPKVTTKPKPKKIILADRLNVKSKVNEAIKKQLPKLDINNLTFKTLKNLVPKITGEMFGISPKKLVSLANITQKELQAAQMFINKNADLLINMLPEGSTASGTATGVPNTILKSFYTKTDRAKMTKTGSKAGLAIQVKNKINKKDFLEVFGIVDGKPTRTDRNTSARVLALANLTGKMMTNQAVRQQIPNMTNHKEIIQNIKDGTPITMFSKAAAEKFAARNKYEHLNISTPTEFDNALEDWSLISTYMPGVIRATDLYTWKIPTANPAFKGYMREKAAQYPDLFTVRGKGKEKAGIVKFPRMDSDIKKLLNKLKKGSITERSFRNKLVEINKIGRDNFVKFFDGVNEAITKNSENKTLPVRAYYLATSSFADSSHPAKTGAPVKYRDITATGKVRFEHAVQNNYVIDKMFDAIAEGKYEEVRDAILKDDVYVQTIISADNAKILDATPYIDKDGNQKDYGKDMGKDFDLNNDTFVKRFFNKETAANENYTLEPKNIKSFDDNTSIEEKFNINKAGNTRFSKPNIETNKILSKAMFSARTTNYSKDSKGISILDFDDTLATTKSLVKYTAPDGTTGTLNAEQFASTYQDLQDQGYKFDFSDFNKVVKGKLAPLFNKAIKLQKKFGPENMFVLTARPPQAQKAIFDFLKANGLNIPLKNITGLGNSTSEAKALWVADKVGEGYNDFYFADDALQNVQAVKNMLDQFDVKSKVQQAKIKFSKGMSREFNDILEGSTGVESMKEFSDAQAKIRGARTKYKSIIPASAQDFAGLLYNFLGRSKKGEADMAFFKKALIDPFARGINDLNSSKQSAATDYENLKKQYPQVKKIINKKAGELNFTNDQAVRVYLWDKAGFDIPGLSKRDLDSLKKVVNENADLKAFAEGIGIISKEEAGYSAPGDFWLAETITSDLLSDGAIGDKRADFLAEWQQNRDVIFSPQNLNKIEAIYGSKFREALQDILYRMETGRNRPTGSGRLMNTYMNWVNNSVGAIMFFNMRSALLQTISATNFINWSDNNPLKAAAAFANQPQYWKDFAFLFNSDFLKQRRAGNQRGINEAELSSAVAGAENKAKAAIAWLLKKGFLPTQIADSFAISSGGATFYRNRFNKYTKEGMTKEQAEKQAFLDFQETSEVAQQSARPDMISQQQASPLGRLILSFQNTPMQYARIINKAARDLVNGRGDYKTHVSKIAYYGVVQSIIFGALQSALFAALGEDDEEEFDKKKERILNGALDSILSGIGYGGKAISTVKNTAMTYLKERDKGFRADHTYTILSLLSFSPPIGSKLRKIYSSIQTEKFNKDVFKRRGFSLDNPIWSGIGNVVEGFTNIPLGRISNKMLNIDNALDANNELWQRLALVLGWNTWDLGIRDPDIEAVKGEIKEEKKQQARQQAIEKTEQKKKEKEEENKAIIKQNKKKKDGRCAAVSSSGKRCKNKAIKGGFCTIHEETEKLKGDRKVQCRKRKADGTRCKMQTANKSQFCYYHD